MPRIFVLSSTVIDQIAAGEVVERPASVVKELVENALDAGAATLEIAVEEGGRARIRVADDGCGMERDDARLALERHATSKIQAADDLVGVASFGFRGEALPSIASVSNLEIETAPEDGEGVVLRTDGGVRVEMDRATRRRGTTVTVSRLFFNAPARRKFLRSARSEWRAVVDALAPLALIRRDVRFSVSADARQVLSLPPVSSMRARVGALWGGALAERLVEVDDVAGPVHVTGLVERPSDAGSGGRRTFLSVNGRAVRDIGIMRAAEAAYRSTIPAGVRPTLLLEIVVPGDEVDVNVHPTKAEVRFRDRWPLERAVEQAVRRALGTTESAGTFGARAWFAPRQEGGGGVFPPFADRDMLDARPVSFGPLLDGVDTAAAEGGMPAATALEEAEPLDVPPLIQLRRTYLMFEHGDGIVLIDQHAAHERVLYERFLGALDRGEAPSQRLLFPMTLHLGPAESEAFEEHRDALERLGFEIEGFGGHTLIIRSVPMPHPRFDPERCLRETLDALTGDRLPGVAARHERLAATVACKAAVKAGDPLSQGEMRELFLALARTRLAPHDVHGRATIVHLSWDEVERRFGRR